MDLIRMIQSYETMLTNLRTKNAELFDHLRRKKTISISDMVKMVGEKDLGRFDEKAYVAPRTATGRRYSGWSYHNEKG